MRNRGLGEQLLALIAGSNRAAAMYGDLVELRHERGKLWFWGAYLRTLAVYGWKIPVALLVADAMRELVFDLFHLYISVTPASWRTPSAPLVLGDMGPLLACVMSTLWFVLPYSVVVYGVRDRVVRLTFAVSVGTTIAFLFVPWLSFVAAMLTVLLTCAALSSPAWRGATVVLLIMLGSGVLMFGASIAGPVFLQSHNLADASTAAQLRNLGFGLVLIGLAIVCILLHHRLGNGAKSRLSRAV